MKVDWKKIWDDFDEWMDSFRDKQCSKCNRITYSQPDWEKQQVKIKKLVNAQLKYQMQTLITKGAKASS